jgi:hypothetical protein
MSINIFNNFLEKKDHIFIKNNLYSEHFPWYYNNYKTTQAYENILNEFQFVHNFYGENMIKSNFFNILEPILKKINPLSILRIKANLNTVCSEIFNFSFHKDFDSTENIKTGIYYVNSNNGKTVFENKKEILSEENKFISFPCYLKHAATTHTDEKIRLVINFNWI